MSMNIEVKSLLEIMMEEKIKDSNDCYAHLYNQMKRFLLNTRNSFIITVQVDRKLFINHGS
jgi:predicted phosphatase